MPPRPLGESRSVFVFYHRALELLCSEHGPSVLTEDRPNSSVSFLSDDSPIGARMRWWMRSWMRIVALAAASCQSAFVLPHHPLHLNWRRSLRSADGICWAHIVSIEIDRTLGSKDLTPREDHHDAAKLDLRRCTRRHAD